MSKKTKETKIIDKFLEFKKKKVPVAIKNIEILGARVLLRFFYYYEKAGKMVDANGNPLESGESRLFPKAKILAMGTNVPPGYDHLKVGDIINVRDSLVQTIPNPAWVNWRRECQEDPQYEKTYTAPAQYILKLGQMQDKFYQIDKFDNSVEPEDAFTLLADMNIILTKDKG